LTQRKQNILQQFRTSQEKKDAFKASADELGLTVGEYFHMLHYLYKNEAKGKGKIKTITGE